MFVGYEVLTAMTVHTDQRELDVSKNHIAFIFRVRQVRNHHEADGK
jgi:hypothetical protein